MALIKKKGGVNCCVDCSSHIYKKSTRCKSCSKKGKFNNKHITIPDKTIINSYLSLKVCAAVGKRLCISRHSVSKILKRNGISLFSPQGHPHTDKSKQKIGRANKGKTRTKEFKERMSIMKKGGIPWNKGLKGICLNTGRTHFSAELNKKWAREKRWSRGETSIEKIMRLKLISAKIKFLPQWEYELGVADFYLPKFNTIIFCDGDYWHSKQEVYNRDRKQDEYLIDNGYTVIRVLGSEIINEDFTKLKTLGETYWP